MDVDQSTDALTRVPELPFPDGNLIIQAGSRLFRVYGGFLAARSPIFQGMLSLSQPADAETMEGCPVVKLPDDAEDVTVFLRAIFDSSFFENYPVKTDLCTVVSILRLSNKYAVEYLRRRALVHMESYFSTTLVDFRDNKGSLIRDL
ncbi:hypothetical protein FB45DRAFT_803466 [Roridomyces roridus]|uniref:BTB domain-containing protein n=1 Tax=Roridomyces roridus TaxID=1738132 RepID=A0AAD7B6J5_9AGAR|nr:hypothetical protein FB45DRAFT_803466 [Roridomyces roridus]